MNILSTFGGAEIAWLALKRAGVNITNYISSEIDPACIKLSNKNIPGIIHAGGIENLTYQKGRLLKGKWDGEKVAGLACLELSRNFIGIEKDPEIYEIAKKRVGGEKYHH